MMKRKNKDKARKRGREIYFRGNSPQINFPNDPNDTITEKFHQKYLQHFISHMIETASVNFLFFLCVFFTFLSTFVNF